MVYRLAAKAPPPTIDSAIINPDWFGVIQTGYNGFHGFDRQFEALEGQAIRWPGGTLSETNLQLYDLRHPDVFDAAHLYKYNPDRERPSLSQMLDYCVANDLPFSMVIPTERYATAPSRGEADVRDFVTRLLDGAYGPLPRDVTLEIGNEYYGLDAFAEDPGLYGQLADRLVLAIAEVLDDPALNPTGLDLRIAVQAGKFHDHNEAILEAFSAEALREVDELIVHTLPISLENFRDPGHQGGPDAGLSRIARIMAYSDRWQDEIRQAGGRQDLDTFVSAWTVGASNTDPTKLDLSYQDYGLRAASTMLDMFAGFSVAGVDAAAAWGVHVHNLNRFSQVAEDNTLDLTPAGAMFELMSTHLVGTAFVGDYGIADRSDPFMTYHFAGTDRAVIYVVANDIDDAGETVLLTLPPTAAYEIASLTSLSATVEPHGLGWDRIFERPIVADRALPADTTPDDGTLALAFQRDFEVVQIVLDRLPEAAPAVATPAVAAMAPPDGIGAAAMTALDLSAVPGTADRRADDATAAAAPGAEGSASTGAYLAGSPADDRIDGTSGDDMILGEAGNDIFHASAGSDTIDGGSGSDTLHLPRDSRSTIDLSSSRSQEIAGDDITLRAVENLIGGRFGDTLTGSNGANLLHGMGGDDVIHGGGGMDRLIGGKGRDKIHGGEDRLRDVFVFETVYDSKPGIRRDVIHDFDSRFDLVDLSGIDANVLRSGQQDFAFTGLRAAPHSIWTHDIGRNLLVRGDVNGDARPDFEIEMAHVDMLLATDFLL